MLGRSSGTLRVMEPSKGTLELLGVLISAGAWLCSLATTLMSAWLTLSTDLLPTENFQLGLWETCVVQDLGSTECRPYDSLLGLPPDIKLARILMSTALGTGMLGLLLSIPGLRLVNGCQPEDIHCKRALKAAGGMLSLVAAVLVLVPVSYMAHLTVVRFFDESVPDVVPRWEFGDALFCGWTAGVLHLVAGALLLMSSQHKQDHDVPVHFLPVPVPSACHTIRTRTEYV